MHKAQCSFLQKNKLLLENREQDEGGNKERGRLGGKLARRQQGKKEAGQKWADQACLLSVGSNH